MKLKSLLTNAYLLSIIPFIIFLVFFPVNSKRYNLELLKSEVLPKGHYVYYDDLDNDGVSEKLTAIDDFNTCALLISNENGIIDQWNLRGNFGFVMKSSLFITGDKEGDGKKEIYVFTTSADSIYLHCISNLANPRASLTNRFIAITGKGIKNPDPFIIPAEMDDLDGDGIKELIFGIGTGFSYAPRNVFAYFISKDSLIKSPESSYFILGILQDDINNDGKREIIPYGYSAGNVGPEQAEYHDHSSFLMVLDQNLKFLFKPLEFHGRYSSVTPYICNGDKGISLAALFCPPSANEVSKIFMINPHGYIADSIILDFRATYIIEDDGFKIVALTGNTYGMLDEKFRLNTKMSFHSNSRAFISDYDKDGRNEIFLDNNSEGSVAVYREGLNHPASLKIPISAYGWETFSLKLNKELNPIISVQAEQNYFQLGYRKNPMYYYSYIYYLLIYLSILAFALVIKHLQKEQIKKKYENEKKISELHMALIRSQLDPHFTLNAINSIIYSVNYGDRDLAADRLRCFAGLYRDLVLTAGSSRRSIRNEVHFCETYLKLEKMRFGDKFNYLIDVSTEVNEDVMIPKFLIQIHAENAIKHGLAPLESGGMLKIFLSNIQNELLIEIADNGIGREKASNQTSQSTGKGLEIMDELYSLYKKIYNERIESEIIDLYDRAGNAAGTKVRIRIISASRT